MVLFGGDLIFHYVRTCGEAMLLLLLLLLPNNLVQGEYRLHRER